jgi:hypothetical protein
VTALAEDFLSGALLAGLVIVAAMSLVRTIAHIRQHRRRHRPRANKRFLRRYRATHPKTSRVTVEAPSSRALPVIRPRKPGRRGLRLSQPTSVGSTSRAGADDDQ